MQISKFGPCAIALMLTACTPSGGPQYSGSGLAARTAFFISGVSQCSGTDLGRLGNAYTYWPAMGEYILPGYQGDPNADLGQTFSWDVERFTTMRNMPYLNELVHDNRPWFECEGRPVSGVQYDKVLAAIVKAMPPAAIASSSSRNHEGNTAHRSFLIYSGHRTAVIEVFGGQDYGTHSTGLKMFVEMPAAPAGQSAAGVLAGLVSTMPPEERAAVQDHARELQQRMRSNSARQLASDAAESQRMKAELQARVDAGRRASGTTTGQMIASGINQGLSDLSRQQQGFDQTTQAISGPSPSASGSTSSEEDVDSIYLCARGSVYPPAGYVVPPIVWTCNGPSKAEAEAMMAERIRTIDNAPKPARASSGTTSSASTPRVIEPCIDNLCTAEK